MYVYLYIFTFYQTSSRMPLLFQLLQGPDVQPVEDLEELHRQTQEMSGVPITVTWFEVARVEKSGCRLM